METMEILFKATSEEAEALRKNLGERYPAEEFSMMKLSYPTHNNIHCFALLLNPTPGAKEFPAYVIESLSGPSSTKS